MSRPHSDTEFNENELQETILNTMDENKIDEKFEEMLVSYDLNIYLILISFLETF